MGSIGGAIDSLQSSFLKSGNEQTWESCKDFQEITSSLDGRERMTKMIQFTSRMGCVMFHPSTKLYKTLKGIQSAAGDARKVFNIGKGVSEAVKVRQMISSPVEAKSAEEYKESQTIRRLDFVGRSALTAFWWYDNMALASKLGIIGGKPGNFMKRACQIQILALSCGLTAEKRKLDQQRRKCVELQKSVSLGGTGNAANQASSAKDLVKSEEACKVHVENLTRMGGDMIMSINGAGVPKVLFGRDMPEFILATSGFISAFISIKQTRMNHFAAKAAKAAKA